MNKLEMDDEKRSSSMTSMSIHSLTGNHLKLPLAGVVFSILSVVSVVTAVSLHQIRSEHAYRWTLAYSREPRMCMSRSG